MTKAKNFRQIEKAIAVWAKAEAERLTAEGREMQRAAGGAAAAWVAAEARARGDEKLNKTK